MATIISIRQDMITLPVMICSLCSKLCLTTIRLSLLDLATCVAAESAPALDAVEESAGRDDGVEGAMGSEWARNGRANNISNNANTAEKPTEAASGRDRCGPEGIA